MKNLENKLHLSALGRPTVLTPEVEKSKVNHLLAILDGDFPLTTMDVRMCVKRVLDQEGRDIQFFNANLPGMQIKIKV